MALMDLAGSNAALDLVMPTCLSPFEDMRASRNHGENAV
jgi:hypothetical protein